MRKLRLNDKVTFLTRVGSSRPRSRPKHKSLLLKPLWPVGWDLHSPGLASPALLELPSFLTSLLTVHSSHAKQNAPAVLRAEWM